MALFRKKDPRETFVSTVEKRLQRMGMGPVEYDEDLFAIRFQGESRLIMLGNVFGHWQSLRGRAADDYLESALAGMLADADRPATFGEASDRLYPGIRDRATIESARWMAELGGSTPVDVPHRRLGANIVALLLFDAPTTMMTVSDEHLAEWGVPFDHAFDISVANLEAATTVAPWSKVGDVYVSGWSDDYDASRLLLPRVIDSLDVRGDPVVFVPHRNRLIVTGADDAESLGAAMVLTEQELDQPSQISAVPLVRRGGVWGDLALEPDHPAAAGLRRLRAADQSLAYGATTPLIQAVVGEEVYVANSILAEKDGVITSACTWVDTPCILPETDRILFFRSQEENWMVEWEDAVEVFGDRMEPTSFYPRRWRVEGFPTPDELAALPTVENWRD